MRSINGYDTRWERALSCFGWVVAAIAVLLSASAAQAADPAIDRASPMEVQRGAVITLAGSNLTEGSGQPLITFCPATESDCKNVKPIEQTAFMSVAAGEVKFVVPYSLALGRYTLQLKSAENGKPAILPGIRVAPPELRVDAVIPHVALPDEAKKNSYELTVRGSGFSSGKNIGENKILFSDATSVVPCETPTAGCTVTAAVSSGNDEITFSGIPAKYLGIHKVRFQIDGGTPSAETTISFSQVLGWIPRVVTIGVLIGLLVIICLMLASGKRRLSTGTAVTLLRAAFIDPETNTYSLSKLQFYIWLFVGLGSYIYLSIAKSLVQGIWTLSDVPSNLPMIAAISVGTSVVATGISSVAGPKGAGDSEPTFSDLITSGGVVAPERLQFLLWNIIGGAAYLFYTFWIGPEKSPGAADDPKHVRTNHGRQLGWLCHRQDRPGARAGDQERDRQIRNSESQRDGGRYVARHQRRGFLPGQRGKPEGCSGHPANSARKCDRR
jgi:hypothetical protein